MTKEILGFLQLDSEKTVLKSTYFILDKKVLFGNIDDISLNDDGSLLYKMFYGTGYCDIQSKWKYGFVDIHEDSVFATPQEAVAELRKRQDAKDVDSTPPAIVDRDQGRKSV